MIGFVKRLAFGLVVAAGFFALIEVILSVVGVVPLYERADPYVGFSGYSPLFHQRNSADNAMVYETAHNKVRWFNVQRFPVRKAQGTVRIFCLGGSTTYGRPYDDRTSFCGWLRNFLPAVDPDTNWEIINTGGISYASYRVARLMEELAEYEPDIFIVYSGHNEFLERRTYDTLLKTPEIVRDLGTLVSRLRLYSTLYDVTYDRSAVLPTEVKTLLERSIGPKDYQRDDKMRGAVLNHYRNSLLRMTHISQRAGARMILVTPASNLGNFSPFKSEPGPQVPATSIEKVESLKRSIKKALEENNPELALTNLTLDLDTRDADLRFLQGQTLRALGRAEEARSAFEKSRDEDVCPLRALSPMKEIVAEVARDRDTGLVDFAQLVRERSPDGIPGSELFLDHVHPTIDGNRLLALEIVQEMIENSILSPSPTWNEATIAEITDTVNNSLDKEAHATALKNLSRVLLWAGKEEEAERMVNLAVDTASEDGETHFTKATLLERAGNNKAALKHYREAARLAPANPAIRQSFGVLLSELGYKTQARVELEAAIRLDRTRPGIFYDLGIVLEDIGMLPQAETAYRSAIQMEPNNADTHNNLGIILARRGNLEAAAKAFSEALRIDPNHANARSNFKRASRRTGRTP